MQIPFNDIILDILQNDDFKKRGITVGVLRLDKIHEQVSGNKLFKLHYFVEECLLTLHKTILTFGGAYSNHLAATAFLCMQKNIRCIGIIRGEQPAILSHTLQNCIKWGMKIYFVTREEYVQMQLHIDEHKIMATYGPCTIIPEGGFAEKGADGAALIMNLINNKKATHVCTSVGTGTTLAGLVKNNSNNITIIAVPAIKNMTDINERVNKLTNKHFSPNVWGDYHFGGYAKYTPELLTFMNLFYLNHNIPTDYIYTAKMMYAVFDKINNGFFKKDDFIICLHTGGLQGNKSLTKAELIF